MNDHDWRVVQALKSIKAEAEMAVWLLVIIALAAVGSCAYSMKINERVLAMTEHVVPAEDGK